MLKAGKEGKGRRRRRKKKRRANKEETTKRRKRETRSMLECHSVFTTTTKPLKNGRKKAQKSPVRPAEVVWAPIGAA
jgi:hypothetical protein